MARATYIWLAWTTESEPRLLGAFTVKHEMMSRLGLTKLEPYNDRGWLIDAGRENILVQRVRDGELR
jgi:hypothetical protein